MKKINVFLTITLFSTLFLSSCGKIVEGFDFPDYSFKANNNNQNVILEKDEGMDIDGVLDEEEWQIAKSNSYTVESSVSSDVKLESMCYLGEKGAYFAVIVDDFSVYYNEERRTSRNTSVEVHFKGFGDLNTKAHCIRIIPTGDGVKVDMKDSTWRLNLNGSGVMQWMTSPFKWEGAAYVKGNMNSSSCEGYVCEAFVPWEVLGVDNHKYIRTYTAFNHVETASLDGDRIWSGTTGCLLTKPNTWKIVSNSGLINHEDIIPELVQADKGMNIDGNLDESVWAEVNAAEFEYKTEAGATINFSASSYMTDAGAYFGFVIKDRHIYYADETVRPIGLNSGMEILFAPYGVDEITLECLQVRITANNVKTTYSGVIGASYPWSNDLFNMLSGTTIQDGNGEGGLNTSKNEGFTVEMFIPWTSFGSNDRLDGVMVLPSIIHSENATQSTKSAPWDYCNVTNAKVNGQTNPQEHFIFMEETGAVLRKVEIPNLFFTDEMLNENTGYYEYDFDVKASYVTLNDKSSSKKYLVTPSFNLPKDIEITKNPDDTYKAKIKKDKINNFKNGVNFTLNCNGKEENARIYYSKIAVDGNVNDSAYGYSYKTLTNVATNIIEQEVSTFFGEQGIFVGFEVKDEIIKNNTHVETFFTLGDEVKVGNTYQIRCYPYSNTYKTYVYQEPDKAGWAWAERTNESKLDVIVDSNITANGYEVELFIPYKTFNLKAAPDKIKILPCVSYYKNPTDLKTSQYHNQSGVSNYYTWDISQYVEFNSLGYVPSKVGVEDIYLSNNSVKDGYYVADLICKDDQNNIYSINEVLEYNEYFIKDEDNNYQLKVEESKLDELLQKPLIAKASDGKDYEFNIVLLNKETASAYIDFTNGTVKNSGSNSELDVKAAAIEGMNFSPAPDVKYTVGIDGDSKGAILTNNRSGAYANISNLQLGNNDFTISTWINVPSNSTLSTGNSSYVFGTANCDDCLDGFRVTVRHIDTGFYFNIRSSYNPAATLVIAPQMSYGEWHNVVLVRDDDRLHLYLDNSLLATLRISSETCFTSSSLNFGAYLGEKWAYNPGNIAYDNISVYDKVIGSKGIELIYNNKI